MRVLIITCLMFFVFAGPKKAWAGELYFDAEISSFYEARGGALYWHDDKGRLTPKADEVLARLENAWHHGLTPAHYHLNDLRRLGQLSPRAFDEMLTDAFILYIQDLSGMRVDAADVGLRAQDWRQSLSASAITMLLTQAPSLQPVFTEFEPQGATYKRLQEQLIAFSKNKQEHQKRIDQLIVNLERLRWAKGYDRDKFVVVNIPSAKLWAVDKGAVAMDMPVVVGNKNRPTISFQSEITGVRFDPSWTMPPTVKTKDIWPKLKEDASYLDNKGIEVFDLNSERQTVDPKIIDWNGITERELHALQMVQKPGAHNPLGRIRVLMPNPYNIFLHDTNETDVFNLRGRTLSSGCVRVSKPELLASFILEDDKIADKYLKDDLRTRDIKSPSKIPVYLVYYTVWVDEQSRVVFGPDIYDHDILLMKKLKEIDEKRMASHNI